MRRGVWFCRRNQATRIKKNNEFEELRRIYMITYTKGSARNNMDCGTNKASALFPVSHEDRK